MIDDALYQEIAALRARIEELELREQPEAVSGVVTSVGGTAPITSSGGTTPQIGITAATTGAAGSMSAADKAKLDGIAAGAQPGTVTNVTGTSPISSSGGTTPAISIAPASAFGPGSMSQADKLKLDGIASGAQPGTVTSVALAVPAELSVSGSPITTSGTLTISKANQNANLAFAGPTSGGAAAPTFRALVAADLPTATTSAKGAVSVPASGGMELSGTDIRRAQGTSFPGSPSDNQLFFRTDHNLEFFYDSGSGYWLSVAEYPLVVPYNRVANQPYAATAVVLDSVVPHRSGLAPYYTYVILRMNTQTTLNATDYWTIALELRTATAFSRNIWSINSYSLLAGYTAAGTNYFPSNTPLILATSSEVLIDINLTRNGAAGTIFVHLEGFYRLRAT